MKLPARGDQTSLFLLALAFLFQMTFWLFVSWLPLVVIGAFTYSALTANVEAIDFVLLAIVLVALLAAAGFCWFLSRGLLAGSRLACLACALVILFFAMGNFLVARAVGSQQRVFFYAQAVALAGAGGVVCVVAFRTRVGNAESAS